MTGWRGRLGPEHLPHALADEDVDDRLRQLPYSWRHRSEPVPSRGRLRVVRRQLGDPIERLLKFASLRGLEVGRLNAGLEPLDQLRPREPRGGIADRKSTRLNSSHTVISYAVFCLTKKNQQNGRIEI